MIKSFTGEYKSFSNFHPCVVHYEGVNYPTVEHAFVAAKTLDVFFRAKISKLSEKQAGYAKRLGRTCYLRPDWDIIKVAVMQRLLMQKFSYHEFKTLLLSTGDQEIVEGNYWHDNFWGDCFCNHCKDIEGKNQLGKLLMKIRGIV